MAISVEPRPRVAAPPRQAAALWREPIVEARDVDKRYDTGKVLIEGVELGSMSDEQRTDYRARRMGFVFQFYNLMPVLTAVENVELPLLVARVPAKVARRKALEAL